MPLKNSFVVVPNERRNCIIRHWIHYSSPGVLGLTLVSFDSDKLCQPTSFLKAADLVPDELMLTAESIPTFPKDIHIHSIVEVHIFL